MPICNSKKVVFYNDKLIVNGKYEINYNDIENCWYTYRTVKSVWRLKLTSLGYAGSLGKVPPRWLGIHIKKNHMKISNNGFIRRHRVWIIRLKSIEIEKLPKSLFN